MILWINLILAVILLIQWKCIKELNINFWRLYTLFLLKDYDSLEDGKKYEELKNGR